MHMHLNWETTMTQPQRTEFATFLLRVTLGIMYLSHSLVLKLATFGLAGTAGFFVSVGLPGWLAYVTFAAGGVGGLVLVLGVKTRWVDAGIVGRHHLGARLEWVGFHRAKRRLGISRLP